MVIPANNYSNDTAHRSHSKRVRCQLKNAVPLQPVQLDGIVQGGMRQYYLHYCCKPRLTKVMGSKINKMRAEY